MFERNVKKYDKYVNFIKTSKFNKTDALELRKLDWFEKYFNTKNGLAFYFYPLVFVFIGICTVIVIIGIILFFWGVMSNALVSTTNLILYACIPFPTSLLICFISPWIFWAIYRKPFLSLKEVLIKLVVNNVIDRYYVYNVREFIAVLTKFKKKGVSYRIGYADVRSYELFNIYFYGLDHGLSHEQALKEVDNNLNQTEMFMFKGYYSYISKYPFGRILLFLGAIYQAIVLNSEHN